MCVVHFACSLWASQPCPWNYLSYSLSLPLSLSGDQFQVHILRKSIILVRLLTLFGSILLVIIHDEWIVNRFIVVVCLLRFGVWVQNLINLIGMLKFEICVCFDGFSSGGYTKQRVFFAECHTYITFIQHCRLDTDSPNLKLSVRLCPSQLF